MLIKIHSLLEFFLVRTEIVWDSFTSTIYLLFFLPILYFHSLTYILFLLLILSLLFFLFLFCLFLLSGLFFFPIGISVIPVSPGILSIFDIVFWKFLILQCAFKCSLCTGFLTFYFLKVRTFTLLFFVLKSSSFCFQCYVPYLTRPWTFLKILSYISYFFYEELL